MNFSPQHFINILIKSSLYRYLPHCAEVCNELRGPSPRLSAWATQLRRNVAMVASCWRHCVDLTGQGIEPQTSCTDSERFATELTADCVLNSSINKQSRSFSTRSATLLFYEFKLCVPDGI